MTKRSLTSVIKILKDKITKKYGSYDDSLDEQVETAAMNKVLIEKMQSEVMKGELTSLEVGSQGQTKTIINPLIAAIDKAQRTYLQQLAALGLNRLSVKKEDAVVVQNSEDPMATFFNSMK